MSHPSQLISQSKSPTKPSTDGLTHRKAAFLLNAFGLKADPFSGELVTEGIPKPRHVALLREQQNRIINVLKGHTSGSLDKTKKKFRSDNKEGYRYHTKWTFKTSSSGDDHLFRLVRDKATGGQKAILAVPIEDMFNTILDVHEDAGHLKVAKTKNAVDEKFYGIPHDVIDEFIKLCPVCNTDQPRCAPHKGAVLPISSHSFRDRIQVDLISFLDDPQANPWIPSVSITTWW